MFGRKAIDGAFKEAMFYNEMLKNVALADLAYAKKEITAAEAMRRIREVLKRIGTEKFD